jgi:hypothetical protein
VCAVFDFVLGYIHERSVPAGVISAVGGLFGTAFYLLIFRVIEARRLGNPITVLGAGSQGHLSPASQIHNPHFQLSNVRDRQLRRKNPGKFETFGRPVMSSFVGVKSP